MKRNNPFHIALAVLLLALASCKQSAPSNATETGLLPPVFPSDFGVTIPYNICPINMAFDAKNCESIFLSIEGKDSKYEQSFNGHKTLIPVREWSALLEKSRGDSIRLTVYSKTEGKWLKHKPFSYFVSPQPIDSYLVYRLIPPGYQTWNDMGIYQRCLSDFTEETVLDSKLMPQTCMNCHSMANRNPDHMLIHLRENNSGTILIKNGKVEKLNTKTPNTFSTVSFPFWHPSAKYIAFSINKVRQLFPATGHERAHAFDQESDMVIYSVDRNEFFTSPLLFSPDAFEAFPCFSPDGKTLYFVTAKAASLPKDIDKVKYSLCAISFDPATETLGNKVDTLVSADKIGKSVTMPRVSPDGTHIMLTVANRGNFPAYFKEADLYMYDTQDSSFTRLDAINSNDVDSYHSWSSNGRWVVFSSRRMDGLYMNPYIAYVDENGHPQKPFLLPQEDADFHKTFMYSFNIPEFAIKKVTVDPYKIEEAAKESAGSQVTFETTH